MNEQEERIYRRPKFDPNGRLVARRALTFGNVTYMPTAEMPSATELGLDSRALYVLWEQYKIDTLPWSQAGGASTVSTLLPKGKTKGKG